MSPVGGGLSEDLGQDAAEVRETHISWVFLHADTVYKVKKPVNFGFLDFTDREGRRLACESEVVLNARLAPGVYLGVVPITRGPGGRHRIGGTGEVVDWAVHMRRLSDEDRADLRLGAGQLGADTIDQLAQLLAQFHRTAASSEEIAAFGSVERIRANVSENFAQAHPRLAELVSEAEQREVESWQLGFLDRNSALFAARQANGRVRDGHGDLRLEHVYLSAGAPPTIIDCIEFNERFRYADVCADVAFLSMDLAYHGRSDLKERLLAAYAAESDDYELYALVDFYESYRAYVRAKVSALGLESAPPAARQRLERAARRYFLLALASERAPASSPRLIAVAGVIASGKSTLARALGRELAAPVLSSDRLRKALRGVSPTTPLHDAPFDANYSEVASRGVYSELLRRAELILRSGRSVILDASFRSRAARAEVQALAGRANVPFRLIECRVSPEVARARLAERARGPSESDGRLQIFEQFLAQYEPITELDSAEHEPIDTGGSLQSALDALRRQGVP